MPDVSKYRVLTTREQAIVAVAVLLDGSDSVDYVTSDRDRGNALSRAARDLCQLAPDLRMPLVGTLLRAALKDLEQ